MDESVKQRVRNWCEDERLFRQSNDDAGAVFHYELEAPSVPEAISNRVRYDTIRVVQPRSAADRVVVSTGIDFGEALSALNSEQVEQIQTLELAMESRPEAYLVNWDGRRLNSVLVFDEIFLDGLTKDRFMLAVRGVNKSFVLALWYLTPLLDELARKTLPANPHEP